MEREIKIFNVGCTDEDELKSIIEKYNCLNNTDFHLDEILDYEVTFGKISTSENYEQIFDFSVFISRFQTIKYIEGRY
jgi:hypothetical protein